MMGSQTLVYLEVGHDRPQSSDFKAPFVPQLLTCKSQSFQKNIPLYQGPQGPKHSNFELSGCNGASTGAKTTLMPNPYTH